MKYLKLYLIGYFVLIVAVGFGIMLAVASSPRVTTTTTHDA